MTFLDQAADGHVGPVGSRPILERLGQAAAGAARPDVAETHLKEAIEIRRSLGDEAAAYRATVWLGEAYMTGRLTEEASAVLEPAVAYAAGVADESDVAALIALLAHVRFIEQRFHEAVALCDRALEVAERIDLYEVIAEALITKGGILASHGRPVEGLSLIETARQLAMEHGLSGPQSRAMNTLTIAMATRDVRATWEMELEGIEFARRVGRRDLELTLIGNAGEDALRLGDWDWHAREIAAFDDVDLPAVHRIGLAFSSLVVKVLRGDPNAAAEVERLERLSAETRSQDYQSTAGDIRAWAALAEGRFEAARDGWMAQAAASDTNAPFALPRAARVAVMAGDAAGAREALDLLTLNGTRGHVIDVERLTIAAGIAAIEGQTEDALTGFHAAISEWHEMGLPWDQAWTAWSAVELLGPSIPQVRAWGVATRAIFEQLGAVALLARLDAALGDAPGPATASPVTAETEAEVAEPA